MTFFLDCEGGGGGGGANLSNLPPLPTRPPASTPMLDPRPVEGHLYILYVFRKFYFQI